MALCLHLSIKPSLLVSRHQSHSHATVWAHVFCLSVTVSLLTKEHFSPLFERGAAETDEKFLFLVHEWSFGRVGLRRWIKAPISQGAWVRIPQGPLFSMPYAIEALGVQLDPHRAVLGPRGGRARSRFFADLPPIELYRSPLRSGDASLRRQPRSQPPWCRCVHRIQSTYCSEDAQGTVVEGCAQRALRCAGRL